MKRHDGRADDELRKIELVPGFLDRPAGCVLVNCGGTRVLCTASVEEKVPGFLYGQGEGWVTGEYAMIPGATGSRTQREVTRGRQSGRTHEIQRLIGRALRSVVDRAALGERTVWIDCEVLQADGGTRTASVTGGFVALCLALSKLMQAKMVKSPPLTDLLAALSVGMVDGRPVLDLDYVEDSSAEVDMNVVRTGSGAYVEVQGTAESAPFSREQLDQMLVLADRGLARVFALQREVLGSTLDALVRR